MSYIIRLILTIKYYMSSYAGKSSKTMSKYIIRDKKHKIYRDDDSDEESEGGAGFPGFPDFSSLMKTDKKKVFRDHNHIYFRCEVTMNRVNKLCNLIEEYNREQESLRSELTTAHLIPKPIYLHITSLGGDMLAGFLAFDYIKNSKIPISTVAEGYAVSSGANMFMAGHNRYMTENSYVLIHQLNITKCGRETFHDMVDEASNVIEFMTKLYGIFLNNVRHNRSNISPQDTLTKEKLENHMLHDIYWNYETCKRYGLVDGLYTNYANIDEASIQSYLNRKSGESGQSKEKQKIYNLEDLVPSDVIVQKIKQNLAEQKNNDMVDMIKKHLSKKLSTDGQNGILNFYENNGSDIVDADQVENAEEAKRPNTRGNNLRQCKNKQSKAKKARYNYN